MTSVILVAIIVMVGVYFLWRNQQVYNKQIAVLTQVKELVLQDISQNREWRWRYDQMEKVSYHKMVLQFWKPLDSWYEDAPYLR